MSLRYCIAKNRKHPKQLTKSINLKKNHATKEVGHVQKINACDIRFERISGFFLCFQKQVRRT
jgi:hypothetical protein